MVLPVADHLAVLGVLFIFAIGYAEGYDQSPHMSAPTLAKPFGDAALANQPLDLVRYRARAPGSGRCPSFKEFCERPPIPSRSFCSAPATQRGNLRYRATSAVGAS